MEPVGYFVDLFCEHCDFRYRDQEITNVPVAQKDFVHNWDFM